MSLTFGSIGPRFMVGSCGPISGRGGCQSAKVHYQATAVKEVVYILWP